MADYIHIERIEAYFSGQLSAEEKSLYENDLNTDLIFKKEHELYIKSQEAIQHLKRTHLKDKVRKYMNQKQDEKTITKKQPVSQNRFLLIAASFIFLIFCASLFYANTNYCDKCLVDTSSFDVYTGMERGDDISEKKEWQRINQFIQAGQFDAAINDINSLDSTIQELPSIQFIKLKAFVQKQDFQSAETLIEILGKSKSKIVKELSDWQSVQIQLIQKKYPDALEQIEEIRSTPSHGYSDKANQMHKKLESVWRLLVF